MNNEQQKGNHGTFWLGFFLGGFLGALLLFLFGTKKGKKLAEHIVEKVEEFEEGWEEKITTVQRSGEDFLEKAQDLKDKIVEEVELQRANVSDEAAEKIDETLSQIEELQRKGVEMTEEVRHRVFKRNGKPLAS